MGMQSARATWTDERLDDLAARVNRGFAELRADTDTRFDRVDRDIRELRGDMKSGHDALRAKIKSGDEAIRADLVTRFDNLERTIRWFGGTLFAALLVAFLEGRF
jgi:hypothetical protein